MFEYGTTTGNSPVPLASFSTESIPAGIPGRTSRRYTSSSGGMFGIKATSRMFGHGCDNPTDPNNLSNVTCPDETAVPVDQAKRCFMAEFSNVSQFEIGFRIITCSRSAL
ncbi:unnamed protein product [Prorocentrum cordatum]|uniref:Uncharacterized protein n=1 Tax=Prorocentrum cordatum TaxID=2364126 RepID=A0ABN9RQJ0_9DINO|nr:unnamed protein product [Polarella glacialis]